MRHQQQGFTLIEMIVAAIVMAGMMAVAVQYFGSTRETTRLNRTVDQILRLEQGIRRAYENETSYNGLSLSVLDQRQAIPSDIKRGSGASTTIVTALGNAVNVWASSWVSGGPSVAGASFQLTQSGLSKTECIHIARQAGPAFVRVATATGTIASDRRENPTPATIANACNSTSNTLYLVSN